MRIQTIAYTAPDRTMLRVELTDQPEPLFVPWPCTTWHAEPIEAWLAEGNAIAEPPA